MRPKHTVYGTIPTHLAALACPPEDAAAAIAFAEAFIGGHADDHDGALKTVWFAQWTIFQVDKFLHNYGDTGFGDKPPTLNRVTYWAQHIGTNQLEATARMINDALIDRVVVFQSSKPPSSAPKCKVCKTKLQRGDLGLRTSRFTFDAWWMDRQNSVRRTTSAIVCAGCVDEKTVARSFRAPLPAPVQRDVAPSHKAAAEALCRVVDAERRKAVAMRRWAMAHTALVLTASIVRYWRHVAAMPESKAARSAAKRFRAS